MKKIIPNIRALIKLLLFLFWLFVCLIFAAFTYPIGGKTYSLLVKLFFRITLMIFNVKTTINKPEDFEPEAAMYVSNHISYLDIFIFGKYFDFRYTPKSEVAEWPILNWLVNLSKPIYLERNPKKSLEQKNILLDAIKDGDQVLLFPEGTTSNAREVLPFKSSLFSVVYPEKENPEDIKNIELFPLCLKYTSVNGKTFSESDLEKVAWYDEDMDFVTHFWGLLRLRKVKAKLKLMEKIDTVQYRSRKELAKDCEEKIRKCFNEIQ